MISNLLISLFSFSVLSLALFHQHYLGMEPCSWCVFQRFFFALIFIFSTTGIFIEKIRKVSLFFVSILSSLGMLIATYQTFWANQSKSCAISFAEKFISFTQLNQIFPTVFESYALCAESNVSLIGIPYSAWGLFSFFIIFVYQINNKSTFFIDKLKMLIHH